MSVNPLLGIRGEHLLNEVLSLRRNRRPRVSSEIDLSLQDRVEYPMLGLYKKIVEKLQLMKAEKEGKKPSKRLNLGTSPERRNSG